MATEYTRRTSKGIIEELAKLARKTIHPLRDDWKKACIKERTDLLNLINQASDLGDEKISSKIMDVYWAGVMDYDAALIGLRSNYTPASIDFQSFNRSLVYSYQAHRREPRPRFKFYEGSLSSWTTQMCLLARTERHGKDRTLNRLFDKYYVGQTYRYEPLYYARYFINEAEHDAELKRGVIKWFGLPPDASDEALLDKMWAHHFKHAHCDYDKQATDLYVTAPQCCIPFQIFYLADRMQIELPDEFKPWADAFAKVEMVYDEITEQVEVAMAIRGIA